MAGTVSAQSKRSLKDIDNELKQTKSTATAQALIEQIGETTPQTDEDVTTLGQLMDKYPTQGQKALAGIKNPKLAQAVQTECSKQVDKFKTDKGKDWSKFPQEVRVTKLNAYFASQAMIAKLGDLKNKDSLPFLKQYITSEYDGMLSYEASKAIGQIAPDDPAVFKVLWEKQGVKSISYNAYGKSVLKEVAQKMQDPNVSKAEKDHIRGKANVELLNGSTPEEKQLLKDIVLNHPDRELRLQAGQAMTKALMFHPDSGDVDFVLKWTKNVKDPSTGWVITYMRDHFDARYTPVLLDFLKEGDASDRSESVSVLEKHQVKEALPYIKDCITKDKDSSVRGNCRATYWKMTGEMSSEFTPEEAKEEEEYLNNPRVIKINAKRNDDDPNKKQYHAQKEALAKYKAAHQR